jgi:cytochrome bd-type quinol oxidase subunit 2
MKEEKVALSDLQNIWQAQKIATDTGLHEGTILHKNIKALRTRMVKSNLFATASLMLAFSAIVYIFIEFEDKNLRFVWSIIAILFIIIVVSTVIWLRLPSKYTIGNEDTLTFINRQINHLSRTKLMIRMSPFYSLLLGVLLNVYFTSITDDWEFIFYVSNLTWLYLIIVTVFSYDFRIKKYDKEVQPIINQLKKISHDLR